MSATMTMGLIETKVRKEHLKDIYATSYRWSPQTVLVFIYDAIEELCINIETWAQFDQDTGDRLETYNIPFAKTLELIEDDSSELEAGITTARESVIPIDNRWEQSIVLLAAAKCLMIDDNDTVNTEKASTLKAEATRLAIT